MDKKKLKYIKLLIVVVIVALLVWFLIIKPSYNFKKYESQLEAAGKKYFEQNPMERPTGSRIATVTMQTLFHKSYLKEDFYIPYTKEPCDLKESWVKVTKKDGEYKYYTNLKCGAMKSSVDSKGPEIKLVGDEKITIDLGEKYKEPGIKSVVDNSDGKMDIKKVKINSSKVDTSKVGVYEVTYKVQDSLQNKTEVTRTVEVVSKLKNAVKKETNDKGYYVGKSPNNYLRMSGMLFRIISVEGDNVRVVAEEDVANVNYDGIVSWLDDYYMNHINEETKKLLVKNKYCNMKATEEILNTNDCTSYTEERYVYIPSFIDVNNTKDEKNETFMKPSTMSWLSTEIDKDKAYVTRSFFLGENKNIEFYSNAKKQNYGVRPVLTIDGDTLVKTGNGTYEKPYEFGETKPAKTDDLVNTRYSGEYIKYGGILWRIVEVNDDGTTKIISVENIKKDGQNVTTNYKKVKSKSRIYNPDQTNNIGYYINNKVSEFIDTSYFANKNIYVPIYKNNIQYQKEKSTKTYKVKLSAPNMYDLFSAASSISQKETRSYWLINSSKVSTTKAVVTDIGVVITEGVSDFTSYGIRVVGNLKKDVIINKGKGTLAKPYSITR